MAPQTIFLAASRIFAVSSTRAGLIPPSSSTTGVKFSAAALATILPTVVLPVKKMKSKGSARSAVFSSRPPGTATTAPGSKYFGTSFKTSSEVSINCSESLRTHVLPAASAVIRVLIVEDMPHDAELVVAQLRSDGFDPKWKRVETEADFLAEIENLPD